MFINYKYLASSGQQGKMIGLLIVYRFMYIKVINIFLPVSQVLCKAGLQEVGRSYTFKK